MKRRDFLVVLGAGLIEAPLCSFAQQFEMVLNRKTAKLLGIVIPQQLLLRADRAIE
jgi:ABC-type uncharacterized transport system substrate-binding protein